MNISVALCTYNGARFLSEQLASIAAQTHLPRELVVCDDRSADGTMAILQAFATTAPFPVRLAINDARLGLTKNFERVIGLCVGDAIALSDQDDVWHPDKLSLIAAKFATDPAIGAVFSDADVVDEDLQPIGLTMFQHDRFGPEQHAILESAEPFRWMLTHTFVPGMTIVFRAGYRDMIAPIPTHDRFMIHDRWIILAVGAVARIGFVNRPLVRYRQHGGQQVGAVFTGRAEGGIAANAPVPSLISQADTYRAAMTSMEVLRARARSFGTGAMRLDAASSLDSYIRHLRARSSMPGRRLRRVPHVLRELASRRYARHSRGVYSAIKDLIV